jgi:hypothetical protein
MWRRRPAHSRITVTLTQVPTGFVLTLRRRVVLRSGCREELLGVGTTRAAALVAHIDALLDLDGDVAPGSRGGSPSSESTPCQLLRLALTPYVEPSAALAADRAAAAGSCGTGGRSLGA